MIDTDRAVRAFEDVVAVEHMAPGMVRVVTWTNSYPIDAWGDGCNCPDKRYNDVPFCKHELAALAADVDRLPSPGIETDDLRNRAGGQQCP